MVEVRACFKLFAKNTTIGYCFCFSGRGLSVLLTTKPVLLTRKCKRKYSCKLKHKNIKAKPFLIISNAILILIIYTDNDDLVGEMSEIRYVNKEQFLTSFSCSSWLYISKYVTHIGTESKKNIGGIKQVIVFYSCI